MKCVLLGLVCELGFNFLCFPLCFNPNVCTHLTHVYRTFECELDDLIIHFGSCLNLLLMFNLYDQ